MLSRPPQPTLFPYTTLFRSQVGAVWWPQHKDKLDSTANIIEAAAVAYGLLAAGDSSTSSKDHAASTAAITTLQDAVRTGEDRKSTRLNSSHANISYAVFCLK